MEAALPIDLQVDLLAKVAGYDRAFAARAGERAKIAILTKPGHGESARFAPQLEATMKRVAEIGGRAHDETIVPYQGAEGLAALCRAQRLAIVYFGPGVGSRDLS